MGGTQSYRFNRPAQAAHISTANSAMQAAAGAQKTHTTTHTHHAQNAATALYSTLLMQRVWGYRHPEKQAECNVIYSNATKQRRYE